MLDLKHLYQILDYSYRQRDRVAGESVCIVVVPPREISEQFDIAGKEGEDSSPAHCTVAYLGTVPLETEEKIKRVAEAVSANTRSFNLKLGKMNIFENPEHDVYHMQVKGKKLHNYREALKHAFAANQIAIDTKHPDYKPHITLEYVTPGEQPKYVGSVPEGKWRAENAWLWGLSEPYLLQFK
jgi:2'-5' RNA ligase